MRTESEFPKCINVCCVNNAYIDQPFCDECNKKISESMNTEIKFCYKHKPTGKFVYLSEWNDENEPLKFYIYLVDEFSSDILYSAKNILMETLEIYSCWGLDHEKDGYKTIK